MEHESVHIRRFDAAAIPGTRIDVIFSGKYDEEFPDAVQTGEDTCLRLEGTLDSRAWLY